MTRYSLLLVFGLIWFGDWLRDEREFGPSFLYWLGSGPNSERVCGQFPTILAHRVAAHLDAIGVVHEPVEDAVRKRRISYLLVPSARLGSSSAE